MRIARSSAALTAFVLALFALGALTCAATEVGQVPSLAVPELDGKTFNLGALRGQVVIVNFWATWCPPCRQEMPMLDAFYRRYHARGVELIGLSADRPHDRSEVTRVMQSYSYPAAMVDDAKTNDFGSPSALPVTFVIGPDGVVRARLTPDETKLTEQGLANVILPLIAHKVIAHKAASSEPDSVAHH